MEPRLGRLLQVDGFLSTLNFQIKCNVFEEWTSYGVR